MHQDSVYSRFSKWVETQPEAVAVGIVMNHGIEMIAAILAVLKSGLAYLTAYFVPSHKNCRLSRIIEFLKARLSDFMVPEYFVRLEEIPLTRRGKVNERALPVVM